MEVCRWGCHRSRLKLWIKTLAWNKAPSDLLLGVAALHINMQTTLLSQQGQRKDSEPLATTVPSCGPASYTCSAGRGGRRMPRPELSNLFQGKILCSQTKHASRPPCFQRLSSAAVPPPLACYVNVDFQLASSKIIFSQVRTSMARVCCTPGRNSSGQSSFQHCLASTASPYHLLCCLKDFLTNESAPEALTLFGLPSLPPATQKGTAAQCASPWIHARCML